MENRIKQLRREKNLTQEELSKIIGVVRTTTSKDIYTNLQGIKLTDPKKHILYEILYQNTRILSELFKVIQGKKFTLNSFKPSTGAGFHRCYSRYSR